MSSKLFEAIVVKFPKTEKKLLISFESCKKRRKFIEVSRESYSEHLELAKDDLNSIRTDFENENWRWVITKSYYAVFHATNALLVTVRQLYNPDYRLSRCMRNKEIIVGIISLFHYNRLGFFSKDHLCAVIALKREDLIPERLYSELGRVYARFSDIFGFAIIFEARKLSQYDTQKWKDLSEEDATIAWNFAKRFVSFVEGECK